MRETEGRQNKETKSLPLSLHRGFFDLSIEELVQKAICLCDCEKGRFWGTREEKLRRTRGRGNLNPLRRASTTRPLPFLPQPSTFDFSFFFPPFALLSSLFILSRRVSSRVSERRAPKVDDPSTSPHSFNLFLLYRSRKQAFPLSKSNKNSPLSYPNLPSLPPSPLVG